MYVCLEPGASTHTHAPQQMGLCRLQNISSAHMLSRRKLMSERRVPLDIITLTYVMAEATFPPNAFRSNGN